MSKGPAELPLEEEEAIKRLSSYTPHDFVYPTPMLIHTEQILLERLGEIPQPDPRINRYKRKLAIREAKRRVPQSSPPLDLNAFVETSLENPKSGKLSSHFSVDRIAKFLQEIPANKRLSPLSTNAPPTSVWYNKSASPNPSWPQPVAPSLFSPTGFQQAPGFFPGDQYQQQWDPAFVSQLPPEGLSSEPQLFDGQPPPQAYSFGMKTIPINGNMAMKTPGTLPFMPAPGLQDPSLSMSLGTEQVSTWDFQSPASVGEYSLFSTPPPMQNVLANMNNENKIDISQDSMLIDHEDSLKDDAIINDLLESVSDFLPPPPTSLESFTTPLTEKMQQQINGASPSNSTKMNNDTPSDTMSLTNRPENPTTPVLQRPELPHTTPTTPSISIPSETELSKPFTRPHEPKPLPTQSGEIPPERSTNMNLPTTSTSTTPTPTPPSTKMSTSSPAHPKTIPISTPIATTTTTTAATATTTTSTATTTTTTTTKTAPAPAPKPTPRPMPATLSIQDTSISPSKPPPTSSKPASTQANSPLPAARAKMVQGSPIGILASRKTAIKGIKLIGKAPKPMFLPQHGMEYYDRSSSSENEEEDLPAPTKVNPEPIKPRGRGQKRPREIIDISLDSPPPTTMKEKETAQPEPKRRKLSLAKPKTNESSATTKISEGIESRSKAKPTTPKTSKPAKPSTATTPSTLKSAPPKPAATIPKPTTSTKSTTTSKSATSTKPTATSKSATSTKSTTTTKASASSSTTKSATPTKPTAPSLPQPPKERARPTETRMRDDAIDILDELPSVTAKKEKTDATTTTKTKSTTTPSKTEATITMDATTESTPETTVTTVTAAPTTTADTTATTAETKEEAAEGGDKKEPEKLEMNLDNTMQSLNDCKKIHEEFYEENPFCRPTFKESLSGRTSKCYSTLYISSPFTGRRLMPFIRRDVKTTTPKMMVIHELKQYHQAKLNSGSGRKSKEATKIPSIDYCYLIPSHLYQVNSLLRRLFWPGIDVSGHIITLDHTVVVLYKRLVIGCGFITPEGYITYIAVDPEWQGLKIGTFILYHLIQTCPDKDITLHVSVNNRAMMLYNKFGFKPEEYIIGFYQKYLPKTSELDPNAFLLRLRR